MRNIKQEEFVFFVHDRPNKTAYSLGPYDLPNGETKGLYSSKDRDGNLRAFNITFTKSKRKIRFHKNHKDIMGTNIVEWLRNHPRCKNSPNCKNVPYFREINTGKDAQIAIDADRNIHQAKGIVYDLDEQGILNLSDSYGFSGDSDVRLHKLLERASFDPDELIERSKSPALLAEACFRRSLVNEKIRKKGFMYYWQDEHLGNTEDEVIKKLTSDKKLLKAIEDDNSIIK